MTLHLREIEDNLTQVNLLIRDPVLMWGGSNLLEDEADQLVELFEEYLNPATMTG